MIRICLLAGILWLTSWQVYAQASLQPGLWRGFMHRPDGEKIVFSFRVSNQHQQPELHIINADEDIVVRDVTKKGDSLIARMPVFESQIRMKVLSKDSVQGSWIKGSSGKSQVIFFTATARQPYRFAADLGDAKATISGKWSMEFTSEKGTTKAIGVFTQKGNMVTGSVVTPTGDYRYLQGLVTGDSLSLSTFDGVHALLLTGTYHQQQWQGHYYSSLTNVKTWTAFRNDSAQLLNTSAMYLKDSTQNQLHFSFPNLEGHLVSLDDPKYQNKVVILQLMGSWCPNCLDETAFLSQWYKQHRQDSVEIIGLAYEYSTDFERSKKSLQKFKNRFHVDYPLLITGVSVSDTLKTEKTLPQFTPIKTFPTTIILDKKGHVRQIETDFAGPGTGSYFEDFKSHFNTLIETLLEEK